MNTRRRRLPPRPAAAPQASPARRLQCVCRQGIDVLPEHHGWRSKCPGCGRSFEILVSGDVVSLAYLETRANGSSSSDTAAETSTSLSPPKEEGALTHAGIVAEPEPPDEAQFRCGCGVLLAIRRNLFDKRISCPSCKGRHLVTLAYDAGADTFTLHTFGLQDRRSGSTRLASRVS